MKYVLIQDIHDENNKMYYILSDDYGQLLGVVDLNCNPCTAPVEHFVVDSNPTLPPCATP
jgi:hypothetical protein